MMTELQNKAWSVLPKEFKEEVKKVAQNYSRRTSALFGVERQRADRFYSDFVSLFGIHNLTSNAEGEDEVLCVPRKQVQEVYKTSKEIVSNELFGTCQYSMHTDNVRTRGLFGSKCLPDEEPKPAEPKEESRNLSQETANCDKQFDNILRDNFLKERRLHIAAMAMQGILSNHTMLRNLAEGEYTPERVFHCIAKAALNYTDALIAEVEKGGKR